MTTPSRKRFGFSGGLVPGVDVMAYMMHLPVREWGRAFLERGLIEARFVKPVYDGETVNVHGEESDGVLSIEVESRGAALRDRHGLASRLRAVALDRGFPGNPAGAGTQAGERSLLRTRQMARNGAAGVGGRSRDGISDRCARARSDLPREGLGHPGLLQRVMNRVLVDNAILGPWIHVGSRMQLLTAPASWRRD